MNTQHYSTISQSQSGQPYLQKSNIGTAKYCKTLEHNINATNYCKPNACYMSPIKKSFVKPTDHAQFSINNRISSNNQYFGSDYNRLGYSGYTPYQYDPTWEEPNILKMFPNGCKTFSHHRFV